jgi:carboxyl-terminal processing protease
MSHRAGVLALAIAAVAAAQTAAPAVRSARIEAFEKVWTTVRDKYWDPKLGGLDWQAVHDELRPKIEAAKTAAEAREILNDMLGRLRQSHFAIFPADVYHDLDASTGDAAQYSGEATPGIDLRILEGRAIVTDVEDGSPAARQGVKPGWEIARIGETEIPRLVARIQEQIQSRAPLDLLLSRGVLARLLGAAGSVVSVEFVDGADRKVAIQLNRVKPRGKIARLGNLPPLSVWSEWRRLPQDVGYVRFNAFFDPEGLSRTMEDAIKGCRDCRGFVLDLRGNPGGIGGLAMGVAGWFTDRPGQWLGTEYLRGLTIKFVIFPRAEPFRGPLALLVDGCSASTSEILAGGLQDLHRARLFGTRTAAAALPSVIERLPEGDGFQYAIASYVSQGGKPLEGIGVTPDEEVPLTRRQLLSGKDPALDAALGWILKQNL